MPLVRTPGSLEVMVVVSEVFCTLVEGGLLQAGYIATILRDTRRFSRGYVGIRLG